MRKSISLLVALAMVLSLFGGFGNLHTASAAPVVGASSLQVHIVSSPPSVNVGATFYVNATVANPTAAAITTSANLGISAGATVLDTNPKTLVVPADGVIDVWWQVKCTAAGKTILTVTASGSSDQATVTQNATAANTKIIVTIWEIPTGRIDVSTNFVVKATVKNVSGGTLTGASATISWTGNVELTNGDVAPIPLTSVTSPYFYNGDTQAVAWNMHCTAAGNVDIKVTAGADGVSAAEVTDGTGSFIQGPEQPQTTTGGITIQVESPDKWCTNCGDSLYTVKARVCNPSTEYVYDVHATLTITGDTSLATIQPPLTVPLGDQLAAGTAPTILPATLFTSDPAVNATNYIRYVDVNGSSHWDAGEPLYFDSNLVPMDKVSVGDTRITKVTPYMAVFAPNYDFFSGITVTEAHDIPNGTTVTIKTDVDNKVTEIIVNPTLSYKVNGSLSSFVPGMALASLTSIQIGGTSQFINLAFTPATGDATANDDVILINTVATPYAAGSPVVGGQTDIDTPLNMDALLTSTTNPWAPGGAVIYDSVSNGVYDLPDLAPGECRVVTWTVHANVPGLVHFLGTATGKSGDPLVLVSDTDDTATTDQKEIMVNFAAVGEGYDTSHALYEQIVADPQPGLPAGDTFDLVGYPTQNTNLVFTDDELSLMGTSPNHIYFDANHNDVYDAGEPVILVDTYPFMTYNLDSEEIFQDVGTKFDVTAFVDNCTCLAWANVLTQLLANGQPIPLVAAAGDNVKWDPTNMYVEIQRYQRENGLDGAWVPFEAPFTLFIDGSNPNGVDLANSLCACCGIQITWHLVCAAASTDELTVKTSSRDNPTIVYDTDTLTVYQSGEPCITTNVQFFKGAQYDSTLETGGTCAVLGGDVVTMVIPVANIGGRTADDIYFVVTMAGDYGYWGSWVAGASGTVTPPSDPSGLHPNNASYAVHIDSLAAGHSAKVIFTLTCSGPADLHVTLLDAQGDSTITYLDSLDGTTPDPLCQYPSSGTLVQVPLGIGWQNPGIEIDQDLITPGVQVEVSRKFAVKIHLYNLDVGTGVAGTPGFLDSATDLTNVTVTLHWGTMSQEDGLADAFITTVDPVTGAVDNHEGAEIWGTNQSITRTLNGPLVPGMDEAMSWEMHCTSPVNVYFWVTVEAQAGTGSCYAVSAENPYSYQGIPFVGQLPATSVVGTIVSPAEYSVYATGSRFAVTATFANDLYHIATNVVVGVFFGNTAGDPAAVVTSTSPNPEDVSLGDMLPGTSRTITWEMQATRPTPSGSEEELVVYYKGDNSYLTYHVVDTNTPYYIYPAAHLVVAFNPIVNPIADQMVGSDFTLTGTVRNIGWADASDVVLHLAVNHGDVAPAPGSGYTLPLGLIPAERDGPANPIPFTWHLQAEAVGKAYIVITATGSDEYGYSHRVDQLYGSDYGLLQLPDVMFDSFADFLARGIIPLAPIPTWATEVPDTLAFNVVLVNPVSVVSTTLNLINGYQLISVPFTVSTSALGSNVTGSVFEWTGVLWGSVTTLNPGIGYLVNHTGVEAITLNGTATSSPFMRPSIGTWQLIGDPFEVAIPWTNVTGSAIAEAYSWNGTIWVLATGSMQPGIGYLIRTTSVGTLTFVRP